MRRRPERSQDPSVEPSFQLEKLSAAPLLNQWNVCLRINRADDTSLSAVEDVYGYNASLGLSMLAWLRMFIFNDPAWFTLNQ